MEKEGVDQTPDQLGAFSNINRGVKAPRVKTEQKGESGEKKNKNKNLKNLISSKLGADIEGVC